MLYLLAIPLGSRYMRTRPAYSLRGTLTVYNLGVTLLSAYMLVEVSGRLIVTPPPLHGPPDPRPPTGCSRLGTGRSCRVPAVPSTITPRPCLSCPVHTAEPGEVDGHYCSLVLTPQICGPKY